MAKEKENGYTLICPGCGAEPSSPFRAAICATCGQVAVMPASLDKAFADIEGDGLKVATKPEKKPARDTKNRSAENGGEVF